jgi:hypothetical protein
MGEDKDVDDKRGDSGKGEPDWLVLENDGTVPAAFEVTEITRKDAEQRNAKLRNLAAGTTMPSTRRRQISDRDAEAAYNIVRNDPALVPLQKFVVIFASEDGLAAAIVERIDRKKTRPDRIPDPSGRPRTRVRHRHR